MTSPLELAVGPQSLVLRTIFTNFQISPFDNTAFAVNAKVGVSKTGLTTPVESLSLLQLTLLSRSAIRCVIDVLVGFVLSLCFLEFSVGKVGFFSQDSVRYLPFSLTPLGMRKIF